MPSLIDSPIVIPATAERTFDEWFYTNFSCSNLHDEEQATLTFHRVPRSSATKELLYSHAETVTRPFWPLVTPESPAFNAEAAQAMAAVLIALPTL